MIKLNLNLYLSLLLNVALIQVIFGQVNWQTGAGGVQWAPACDFYNNRDMGSTRVPGEQCGEKCIGTSGCSHFAWTNYQGGTCWMKTGNVQKSDAKFNGNYEMICGIVPASNGGGGGGSGTVYSNVRTTFHGANEVGACQLPAQSYSTAFPVALGDISSLGNLRFSSNLCGHILAVKCGNGPVVNILVMNSNLGGGLDLYGSSWRKATNNASPGVQSCSVQMTSQNIFTFDGYVCYHATGETNNQYYRNVGLLNVKDKIVVSASYNGIAGRLQSNAPYFEFNGQGNGNTPVIFRFSDGSTHSVPLNQCKSGADKKTWN